MNNIEPISESVFNKKFKIKQINLRSKKLITTDDLLKLEEIENRPKIVEKIKLFLNDYLTYSLKHPSFFYNFVLRRVLSLITTSISKKQKVSVQRQQYANKLIETYERRARIAKAFSPSKLLEIGTFLGMGTSAFKLAMPTCSLLTISPKESDSNNPTHQNETGYFFIKKGLKVKQIWTDSTKYNFKKLKSVDVSYIDGNHSFKYVYKDLINSASITRRCILVDDYVPIGQKNREANLYGPWNHDVVRAVTVFVKENPDLFRFAYWIKNTQLCVLIK